jgi:hypothetical protein
MDDAGKIEQLANQPETVWSVLADMPGMQPMIDTMLARGWTPERICMRPPFSAMPVGVQTAFINAIHFRQTQLRREGK